EVADQIADGDLKVTITPRSQADIFGKSFQSMIVALGAIVTNVRASAEQINNINIVLTDTGKQLTGEGETMSAATQNMAASVEQLTSNIRNIAKNIDAQSSSVMETSTSIKQMCTQLKKVSENTKQLSGRCESAQEVVVNGQKLVQIAADRVV